MKFSGRDCPIYINIRDRVSDLKRLVQWLEDAGHERIILVDNASTYPDLVEYLESSPHEVLHLGDNYGSRSLWRTGKVPNEYFVYTDPDVVPIEDCPQDAVERLFHAMREWPRAKVALGLYLDDVPNIHSLAWERTLVARRRLVGQSREVDVFDTQSDTTFALWQPWSSFTHEALRMGYPMQARHLPWYHLGKPTEEEQYYLAHAIEGPLGSSWKKQ